MLRVGLDKTGLTAGAGRRLRAPPRAALLDIDAKAFVKQVTAAGPGPSCEAIVYRQQDAPAAVLAGLAAIKGARAISGTLPLAPTKDFAAAILGTVGPATAEIVKDSKGRIKPGDEVGLSGLQKRYDEQLAGTRGATVVAVDDQGQRRTLFTADAEAGSALHTTIDLDGAERRAARLADVGPASALVAIRPSTGDLVAVASGPGLEGLQHRDLRPLRARLHLQGGQRARPAARRRHPADPVSCPPTTVVDGKSSRTTTTTRPRASVGSRFEDALANSCNTAFIGQRDKLGPTSLAEAAAALGLRRRPRHRASPPSSARSARPAARPRRPPA